MSLTKDVEPVFHFCWQVADKIFIGLDSANNLQTIKSSKNKSAFYEVLCLPKLSHITVVCSSQPVWCSASQNRLGDGFTGSIHRCLDCCTCVFLRNVYAVSFFKHNKTDKFTELCVSISGTAE